ncbi:MAG: hypothetical protein IT379_40025 [Deltaproteobacteria bacterium]|nr:hypothetical protein [Deltaproteobacteria bacterium]
MTARHPLDCYLSPPCTALALRAHLEASPETAEALHGWHWHDPFAGPAYMFETLVRGVDGPPSTRLRMSARELDTRWGDEICRRVYPAHARVGEDSFEHDWPRAHVATNFPYGRDEAVQRLRDHARTHGRYACALMRTDWWQHPGRFEELRPDELLMLTWRPGFGYRLDRASGKVVFSTDRYTGYVWALWAPRPAASCAFATLPRPEVPRALRDEHRRLARMAYDMAHAEAA